MKLEKNNFEHHLFVWEGWDHDDAFSWTFYDVTLVVPFGKYPVGHKFTSATLMGDYSVVAFYNGDVEEAAFRFKLVPGEQVTEQDLSIG
jgi:hypothetical protein